MQTCLLTSLTRSPQRNLPGASLPRPRDIVWDDLVALSPRQVAGNLLLSAPWLATSLTSAAFDVYALAAPCSAIFFLTALRQSHDSYHASIGVPRRSFDGVLLVLTLGMLCSTHAIRHTHLVHHRSPLSAGDEEGNWARQPS